MKTILVSAGHSTVKPVDPGAVGHGYKESEIALMMRDAVAEQLQTIGGDEIKIIEDGADGISEPLTKAVALARIADIAIEFHLNAGPEKATGIEVLAKPKNKKLAQNIAETIGSATNLNLRGEAGYKPDNSGQHHRLAFCEAGGLIVELCFISNKSDVQKLIQNFETVAVNIAKVLFEAAGGASQTQDFYTVKAGDTAFGIARKFGIEVKKLKDLNNLNSNYEIKIGQILRVK